MTRDFKESEYQPTWIDTRRQIQPFLAQLPESEKRKWNPDTRSLKIMISDRPVDEDWEDGNHFLRHYDYDDAPAEHFKPWLGLIRHPDLAEHNLPPLYRRLQDLQVGELLKWSIQDTQRMGWMGSYWPHDFDGTNIPRTTRVNFGRPFIGRNPFPLSGSGQQQHHLNGDPNGFVELMSEYRDVQPTHPRSGLSGGLLWDPLSRQMLALAQAELYNWVVAHNAHDYVGRHHPFNPPYPPVMTAAELAAAMLFDPSPQAPTPRNATYLPEPTFEIDNSNQIDNQHQGSAENNPIDVDQIGNVGGDEEHQQVSQEEPTLEIPAVEAVGTHQQMRVPDAAGTDVQDARASPVETDAERDERLLFPMAHHYSKARRNRFRISRQHAQKGDHNRQEPTVQVPGSHDHLKTGTKPSLSKEELNGDGASLQDPSRTSGDELDTIEALSVLGDTRSSLASGPLSTTNEATLSPSHQPNLSSITRGNASSLKRIIDSSAAEHILAGQIPATPGSATKRSKIG